MPTPNTHRAALPHRRVQKQPRVLNYIKCRFCRDPKVKTKCTWDEGSWPSKCRRCRERGLACSQPRHKAEERFVDSQELTLAPTTDPDGGSTIIRRSFHTHPPHLKSPSSGLRAVALKLLDYCPVTDRFAHLSEEDRERIVLQLLPLHAMILMAAEEIKALAQEFLDVLAIDVSDYVVELGNETSEKSKVYDDSARVIQKTIEDLAPYGKLGMEAALDLTRYSCMLKALAGTDGLHRESFYDEIAGVKDVYMSQSHSGMAFLLSVYQFSGLAMHPHCGPDPIASYFGFIGDPLSAELEPSSNYGRWFLSFRDVFKKFSLDVQELMSKAVIPEDIHPQIRAQLNSSQLFIPRRLIRWPRIRQLMRERTVNDFLGRSMALLDYDAGLSLTAPDLAEDTPDILRRTVLHAACIREDIATVKLLSERNSIHAGRMVDGSSPLHIVVATGNIQIFSLLCEEYKRNDYLEVALLKSDNRDQDFLAQAVTLGRHEMVDLYLSTHKFQWGQMGFLDRGCTFVHSTDRVVSALENALVNEQYETIRVMAAHLHSPAFWDDLHRTPLWYGCYYGRTNAIPSLLKLGSTHVPDYEGRTPLMEASRRGYADVLYALLYPKFDETTRKDSLRLPDAWATDRKGKTAKDLAEENEHWECATILSDWMTASGRE